MITQNINKVPFIHFGFNRQSITVNTGDEVVIWQDVIYNADEVDFNITSTGSVKVSDNNNKAILTYSTAGTYNIDVDISNASKTRILQSNIITVQVI
jgi:plastocyanin